MTQSHLKFQAHSPTSYEAAHAARESGSAARCREIVFAVISAAGNTGMTDEDIAIAARLPGNTCRPRRVELLDAGRIIEAGKRKTLSGRNACVWMVSR